MTEQEQGEGYREKVVDEVVDKVAQRQATPDDHERIRPMAEEAVDEIIDEPVQSFTPLIAENQVVTQLLGDDQGAARRGEGG